MDHMPVLVDGRRAMHLPWTRVLVNFDTMTTKREDLRRYSHDVDGTSGSGVY